MGDTKNNKAFHNAVKIRETRNAIREIYPSEQVVSSQEEIKKKRLKDFLLSFYLMNQMICTGELWKKYSRSLNSDTVRKRKCTY